MDHLRAVLDGNLDNLIASEIRSDRGILTTLSNDVGFVGLYSAPAVSVIAIKNGGGTNQRAVLCRCMLRRSS